MQTAITQRECVDRPGGHSHVGKRNTSSMNVDMYQRKLVCPVFLAASSEPSSAAAPSVPEVASSPSFQWYSSWPSAATTISRMITRGHAVAPNLYISMFRSNSNEYHRENGGERQPQADLDEVTGRSLPMGVSRAVRNARGRSGPGNSPGPGWEWRYLTSSPISLYTPRYCEMVEVISSSRPRCRGSFR